MIRAFRTLTINRLGKWLISLLILSAFTTLVTSWHLVRDVTNLNTSWSDNERSIIQKQAYLSALRGAIGYGGMIHYFKNYLLRHDKNYLLNTHRSLLESKIIINGYRALGVSTDEDRALSDLEDVAQEYKRAITRAEVLVNAGYTIAQTDKLVSVDDAPAIRALLSLTDAVATLRQAKTKIVSTKIGSLADTINVAAIGIGLLLVILILALAWFLRSRLINPLSRLITAFDKVDPAAPGLTRLPGSGTEGDELDMVATAGNRFLDTMEIHLTERRNAEKSLESAREIADKANKAKSEFLSSMSHELRTPMNAILGFAQMLDYNPKEPLTTAQKKSVDHILKGGQHLLELINEVLDLAKIESGKMEMSIEDVSIRNVLDECLSLVQTMAENQGIEIIVAEGFDKPVVIRSDYTRARQALLNLISNAVKYNRENGKIVLNCYVATNGMLRISVTDTGEGISKDKLDELFQPFSRLGAENTEIEGTGIGLVITKQIIESMGGRIDVESEIGKGTTFWIELPVSESGQAKDLEAKMIEEQGAPKQLSNVNGTILYVEDNPANLNLMEMIVERTEGLSMISAHNAELGLELAVNKKPQMIILDINLPGMDGFAALKKLQKMESTKNIPVIALSANAMNKDIRKGLDAGFKQYLTKPIKIDEVADAIEVTIKTPGEQKLI